MADLTREEREAMRARCEEVYETITAWVGVRWLREKLAAVRADVPRLLDALDEMAQYIDERDTRIAVLTAALRKEQERVHRVYCPSVDCIEICHEMRAALDGTP